MRLLVTTRPIAWLSARYLPTLDRFAFRVTRGRFTPSAWVTGLPIVTMTTTGARSGRPQTVRLLGIPEGDGYLVVAANFGAGVNPAWYYNVRAHLRVTIDSGGYDVTELQDDERDAGFERALALNPGWTRFRERAGARAIPVLRLTPAER
jgi:deazaflavin-dependent oxidoreductase (nitroreductase family)